MEGNVVGSKQLNDNYHYFEDNNRQGKESNCHETIGSGRKYKYPLLNSGWFSRGGDVTALFFPVRANM
jgi:hypothetical protein